mgnify:FL=1|tara:strand:- start:5 stop:949 length:945 start_codon:yes stop_codon:yes gene_type:complete
MEIRWFSELPLDGKVDRNFSNMRTEFAWFVAQDAIHTNLHKISQLKDKSVDVGIIIIPKKVQPFLSLEIVKHLKRVCKKYGFMQEGPSWYFQSLPLNESFWFYNTMLQADFVLAHNDIDKEYYEGLLNKPVFINPTLMIEDSISKLPSVERKGTMIGGNLVRWYGGFNSLIVAQESNETIYAPQMGRMDKAELGIQEINHLPYMEWSDWIKQLNKVKFAVHLNPNTIGGTFNLNCAYLGIPCIGNEEANTQKLCFPELSVRDNDIKKARLLMKRLVEDKSFYSYISNKAKERYASHFSEVRYKHNWQTIMDCIS